MNPLEVMKVLSLPLVAWFLPLSGELQWNEQIHRSQACTTPLMSQILYSKLLTHLKPADYPMKLLEERAAIANAQGLKCKTYTGFVYHIISCVLVVLMNSMFI